MRALPEAVGFVVYNLVSLSLALDLTKSMGALSPVEGMRSYINGVTAASIERVQQIPTVLGQ